MLPLDLSLQGSKEATLSLAEATSAVVDAAFPWLIRPFFRLFPSWCDDMSDASQPKIKFER
jgi:hypothetical protein